MSILHKKVSATPSIPGAWVQPADWNDDHVNSPTVTTANASVTIDQEVDAVEAVGGAGGITLTLEGEGVPPKLWIMKTDNGAGAITIVDVNNANFVGPGGVATSYKLVNQGQWAVFIWDGTQWLAFGV